MSPSMSSWTSFGAYRISSLEGISASSSVALLNQARARLDKELEAVFATAAAIRTRRNSLSPIARLHPEILAHVFAFLAADPEEIPMKKSCYSIYNITRSAQALTIVTAGSGYRGDDPILTGENLVPVNVQDI
ncbi:hypothetical protein DENSPDRAFT_420157 [Dentipellis sp. KUC8613]|nr:hypothetical protein DENSPDRAFT_420157 [Dentipellis sp. KUC8613]